jgi:hypothetical protein
MSAWRGQGGRRAKGRRGDQDPELDNTAWLAELEQEAAMADRGDEEEDWASTLRSRRAAAPPPHDPPPAAASEPSWLPPPDPEPPPDHRFLGMEPEGPGPSSWDLDPTPQDPPYPAPPPPTPAAEPDWSSSWRPQDRSGYGYGEDGPPTPAAGSGYAEPAPEGAPGPRGDAFEDRPREDGFGDRPYAGAEPDWRAAPPDPGTGEWEPAGVDTPTGAWSTPEPVGREPDYPALFGELYRRSAGQQDPIWEAPPAAEPLPEPGQPDPPSATWPFEETTQTWEPSDRSFIWPADELPSTSTEWERPSWDDPAPPAPPPPAQPYAAPDPLEQTSAWSPPEPSAPGRFAPEPPPEASGWSPGEAATAAWTPAAGNGMPPPQATPPPADWAAAIPTDVPAARRVADPSAAARVWRRDAAVEAEPAVPLGSDLWDDTDWDDADAVGATPDPAGARRRRPAASRRVRQPDDRPSRAWPRIVAIVSWIVLVMVFCWYYVFPWLERILPENF